MQSELHQFWRLLETDFPPAGLRQELAECLDAELVEQLLRLNILHHEQYADTYPCPRRTGDGCPRIVLQAEEGRYRAVCGNEHQGCEEVELSAEDVSLLAVDPEALCRAAAKALGVRGVAVELENPKHVYRAGSFIPIQGIKYPVYLAVRCAEKDYIEVFHALRSMETSPAFAILVPAETHLVRGGTIQHMRRLGVSVLVLDGVLHIQGGQLVSSVDPLRYFEGLGYSSPAPVPVMAGVVAQALVCNGLEGAKWCNLDEEKYQRLADESSRYEVFADERARRVERGLGEQRERRECVRASYFRFLRTCIEYRGYYDPSVSPPGYEDGKQTFERARKAVDVKFLGPGGKEDWKLFKTRSVDRVAHYEFSPERGTSFALIFRSDSLDS